MASRDLSQTGQRQAETDASSFKLDTFGAVSSVPGVSAIDAPSYTTWRNLTPFAQGYVEAMLTPNPYDVRSMGWRADCPRCVASKFTCDDHHRVKLGFSDLAPATLSRIIGDCERYRALNKRTPDWTCDGRYFWERRQSDGCDTGFPPLTVSLGEDGLIYLAEAGQ
jgi:hypothetical protein